VQVRRGYEAVVRRLVPFVLRSWTLPFVVLALVAPSVAAFALVGPQLGLAFGALSVAALVILAARVRYDEPIGVAAAPDSRYRLLVVATRALEHPRTLAEIARVVAEGERAFRDRRDGNPQVLVLAPARSSALARWASDVGPARSSARDALAVSLAALAAAGLDGVGRVGDGDLVQAVEDELQSFAADEVAILPGPGASRAEIEEVRRRLDRPVRALVAPEPGVDS
jgi:hypothetical protein